MIDYIKGRLVHLSEEYAVLEVYGVGMKVLTSATTSALFGQMGEEVILYTEMIVREDAIYLVGFTTRKELDLYKLLTAVNGVGPKVAIGLLSALSVSEIANAVAAGDAPRLTKGHGVGKKVAERIVLELNRKVDPFLDMQHPVGMQRKEQASGILRSTVSDAIAGLVSLGYSKSEAQSAVSGADADSTTEEIIKSALQKLIRG